MVKQVCKRQLTWLSMVINESMDSLNKRMGMGGGSGQPACQQNQEKKKGKVEKEQEENASKLQAPNTQSR